MALPGVVLDLMRSAPQASDMSMIIQQPQYYTEGPYLADREWLGHVWSCRIAAPPVDDPIGEISVNNGAAAVDLEDGMSIFIGSTLGGWDRTILRLRTDQTVDAATATLLVATSSDLRGRIFVGDYVVVLDEFRLWQRYGRVTVAGQVVSWYKDHDIEWDDIGASDAERRLAAMPPCPIMGPHAVKFVAAPEVNSQFYFDWADSYATAPGETITDWVSEGEQDFAGNEWTSVLETPGWQDTLGISGMRGFRTTLRVWDGNGNAINAPYRRGHRYVFTMRRPGDTQPGDPPYAEPITQFRLNNLNGSFEQGYWKASVTVYGDTASKYTIIPGTLVILFTDDWYTVDSPYMAPTGMRKASVGPIYDRENLLMVGWIGNASVTQDPETGDTTFEIMSAPETASRFEGYPIPIGDDNVTTDWIRAPDLTVDRAAWHYVCWHSTLAHVADYYWSGDTHELKGMDYNDGPFYNVLSSFYQNRLFAKPICDKYGRVIIEVDAQMQAYGSLETLWTLDAGDWADKLTIAKYEVDRVKAAECGGIAYDLGNITPYLSRSPGFFNKYHGTLRASNALAITDQDYLNTLSGRLLNAANYEWDVTVPLAGQWRWLDIVPQTAVYFDDMEYERDVLSGRGIIRDISVQHFPEAGCIFNTISVELEMPSDPAGVTIPIPDELPTRTRPKPKLPVSPGLPPLPGWPEEDDGRRIIATDAGVFVCNDILNTSPHWYAANAGFVTADDLNVWDIKRDPFHWWTSGGSERTLWAVSSSGVWKHELFPTGTWVQIVTLADLGVWFGDAPDPGTLLHFCRITCSIEVDDLQAVSCCTHAWSAVVTQDRAWNFVMAGGAIQNMFQAEHTGDGLGYGNVRFAPHGGGNVIYAASNRAPGHVVGSRGILWKSVNRGGAWANIDQHGPAQRGVLCSISVPYVDAGSSDLDVLWGRGGHIAGTTGRYRVSTDAGASFANIPGAMVDDYVWMGTSNLPVRIWFLAARPDNDSCKWSIDGGTSYTTLPLLVPFFEAYSSHTMWQGDYLKSVLIGGTPTGGAPGNVRLYWNDIGQATWLDKTGNLDGLGPNIVRGIERDSMGSA